MHNRKKFRATVIGTDPAHDLAVIKIEAPNLTAAVLGDSRNLQVGQKVYAIGNPFGLAGTMTRGIVSSIRPVKEPNGATIDEAIQTDAAINPGNSGGPLMNGHGEVIGINTMILSSVGQNAGIGFAIPINTAKAVLNDLVTLGRVRRPALGVSTIPVGPELAEQIGLPVDFGLLIVKVSPGGAAEHAGLRGGTERAYLGNSPIMLGGDLIVAIDGDNRVTHFESRLLGRTSRGHARYGYTARADTVDTRDCRVFKRREHDSNRAASHAVVGRDELVVNPHDRV